MALTLLNQVVGIGSQLLLVPFFLSAWNATRYGEWLAFCAAVAYLNLVDLGSLLYGVNRMTQAWARGEREAFARIVRNALSTSLLVTGVLALGLSALSLYAPFGEWFKLTVTPPQEAAWVAVVLIIQTLLSIPFGFLVGFYRAVGDYPRSLVVVLVQRILVVVGTLWVLGTGGGLLAVALAQLVVLALVGAWAWLDLSHRFPAAPPALAWPEWGLVRSFFSPSLLFLGLQLAQALTVQGSVMIANARCGAVAVTSFAVTRTLANVIRQFVGSLCSAMWPEITGMEARHELAKLRRLHRFASKTTVAVALTTAVGLHTLAPPVLHAWTRGAVPLEMRVIDAMLVYVVLQGFSLVSSTVLAATNQHRGLAWASLGAAIVGLGLATAWVPEQGIFGIVAGLAVGEGLACGILVPVMACRFLQDSVAGFLADVLGRALGFTLVLFAGDVLLHRACLTIQGPFGQACWGLGLLGLAGVTGWGLWYTSSERQLVLTRLRGHHQAASA